MEIITKSPEETKKVGRRLASALIGGEIICLSGDLGAGKTTFVQGLALGLGIKSRLISPTFILVRKYHLQPKNKNLTPNTLFHVDLYRLEERVDKEVINLGITDVWGKKENIVVIEWAEKIKEIILDKAKWVFFENLGADERKIKIE